MDAMEHCPFKETRRRIFTGATMANHGNCKMTIILVFMLFVTTCLFTRGEAQLTDYIFSVDEGRPPETLIGTIPVNVGSTYRFSVEQLLFSIHSTSGEIRTRSELDREELQNDDFDISVLEVRDGSGNIPIEIKISVNDVNDNAPSFAEREVQKMLSESAQVGTKILLPSVTDPDNGRNGTIQDPIIVSGNGNSTFELEVINIATLTLLKLKLIKELDREVSNFYQLRIEATDNGTPSLSSYLILNVSVSDENDNAPTFEQSEYTIRVSENTEIGTVVLQVTATDRDINRNGEVRYRLPQANSNFDVDPVTGDLTLISELVFESASFHSFRIEAHDQGIPSLLGRTNVFVEVEDYNDHEPQITAQFLGAYDIENYVTVEEGSAINTLIAILTVTDADQGDNGVVTVNLTDGNGLGHFQLGTVSQPDGIYKITIVDEIDRESVAEYNLTLYAEDKGTPQRNSTLTIHVVVLDANDYPPEFQSGSYSASLEENVSVGSYVTTVSATDKDTGSNALIVYSITAGNERGWFQIDGNNGLVTTATGLDRETAAMVSLTISATDQGQQPMNAMVMLNVTIMDVNDVIPMFTVEQFQATVPENVEAGHYVTTVLAVDEDLGSGGIVEYSFDDGSLEALAMFAINAQTGEITTLVTIDREEIPSVSLSVKAKDLGSNSLFSMATVIVEVIDENDNYPIFYPTEYFAQVMENEDAGTIVETVTATDADIGNNGRVTYYMDRTNNGGFNFEVDITSGVISTTQVLDRETQSQYTIFIWAIDGEGQQSVQPAVVTVTVQDIQDNLPTFHRPVYNYRVLENAATGTFIGTVSATSVDLQVSITYSIVSGDPEEQFEIDMNTGEIKTKGEIDRERIESYSLQVNANAGILFGSTTVNILVDDENDNAPTFNISSASANVVENWSVGRKIYQAQAYDVDVPPNSLITYELSGNSGSLFNIEADSGWVYINTDLYAATQEEFQLQVRAVDHGTPQLSSTLSLTIHLRDVNNHSPDFEESFYTASISESTQPPTRFITVLAVDADMGSNGMVSYNITHGNLEDKFGIFPDGQVYVKGFLDREEVSEYQLTVMATDNGVPARRDVTTVTVTILDENDNRPFFLNATYDFYVAEEQTVSVVGMVEAVDHDASSNGEVRYFIISNDTDFQIGIKNGLISSQRVFDREQLNSDVITFQVEASDGGNNPLSDRVEVNIHITDVNDNEPIFLHGEYQTWISELAPESSNVITISAMDNDIGDNSYITYSIISGDPENKFHIDRGNGQISVVGSLDRETVPSYTLVVLAKDAGNPSLSAMTDVTLIILDENDHHPVFQNPLIDVEITECVELDDLVTSVSATDEDQGQNSLISYAIVQGNLRGVFRLDPNSGDLYLAKLLDHETDAEYHLNISAQDSGSPTLSSFASVVVTVRDCNDNAPTFSQTNIVKEIDEDLDTGTEVATVLAQDFDSGINGRVSHSIISQMPDFDFFQIDETSGVISVHNRIDRESLPEASEGVVVVIVQAIDQALPVNTRQSATATVTFSIRDINDNRPEIVSQSAAAVLLDATVGSPVIVVMAVDNDYGENARVTYSMTVSPPDFRINPTSGLVSVSRAVQSSRSPYLLRIRAEDGGSPPLSTESVLNIVVTEAQSSGPIFSQSSYNVEIEEGQPVGSHVVTVSASYPNGQVANIEYFITSISMGNAQNINFFSIGTSTGLISTSMEIDRDTFEEESVFTLTVTAADVGSVPPKTRNIEVFVTILDVNDNPPVFQDAMYNTSITEAAGSGAFVLTVTATDADTTSTDIEYSITSSSDDGFHIDPGSGDITVVGPLDREMKAGYTLVVRASDGSLFSTTTVAISILDENDNNPVFSEMVYSFTLPEDSVAPSVVDQVVATDLDEGSNGNVRYGVVEEGAPGEEIFALNPLTGVLTLVQSVDFEEKQLYYLKIKATDQGSTPLTSSAVIYVNVLDINDNSPSFMPQRYSVEVSEDVDVDTRLVTVYATDLDSGPNGAIQYTIQSGDSAGCFNILANGTIVVAKPLDRETQSFYNLEVRAEDMAEDPEVRRSSTAQVSVIVTDINDNSPVFISPPEVHVLESAAFGTFVMTVIAEDPDVERNSYIEYRFDPTPENDAFFIGSLDGNVQVRNHLDREIMPFYTLSVVATDKGDPAQSTTMEITVIVDDVNDNSPVFEMDSYRETIQENVPVGLEFLQVIANDPDLGSNAWISYTIVDGNYNSDFSIDLQSGVLSVAKTLDRERRQSYELTVQAQDSGPGSRFSRCIVYLDIEDVNDNFPVFPDLYRPVIMENNLPGIVVTQVVADDLDEGSNGVLTYSLQGDTYDSLFTIERTTGVIRVTERLDHETADEYTLTVVAEDTGTPQLMGTTQVLISVADANDNPPVFTSDVYSTTVEEEVPLNTPVIRVTATDVDSTAMLRYRLDGDVGNKFTIYPSTGQIVTAGRLDREQQSSYQLLVTVTDSEEKTASATVFITVTDINDNQPQFEVSSYQVTLPTNAMAGTLVTVVRAVDLDVGINAENYYTIQSGDTSLFSVDQRTGAVTISQNLSDQRGEFTVQVGVSGGIGSPVIFDLATIHVSFQFTLLMSYPSFSVSGKSQISLTENDYPGEVTIIHASSPKTGPNGAISFHFAGGNEAGFFSLDSQTGNLSTNQVLDYEVQESFHLWIEARDGDSPPLSSFSDIMISVVDQNDNSPEFDEGSYQARIVEGQSSGVEVIQVTADDPDSGDNGRIKYQLRNHGDAFRIDADSGLISTTRVLDRESVSRYEVIVAAQDTGSPARSTTVVVTVDVDDINDSPMYTTETFEGSIEENVSPGTVVMKITTQDRDIGENAISRFRFVNGNSDDPFAIDELSGDITVSDVLDRESPGGSQYFLTVQAFDDVFQLDIAVTIDVLDLNDNRPTFAEESYTHSIPELLSEGSFVLAVSATDQDSGDNGQISYQLKALSSAFDLNPVTGDLTVGQVLVYQKPESTFAANPNLYKLEILAVDHGFPTMYSEVAVTVEVFDANDHSPVFDRSSYFSPIPAGTPSSVNVIQVEARDDLDEGLNAEVNYFIIGGNGTSRFDVDQETGWISILGNTLEGSIGTTYSLIIQAQDKGRPAPLSSTVLVELVITAANIHPPQFSQSSLTASVPEDQTAGVIATLQASDPDHGINGEVTYTITSGDDMNQFSVDPLSGEIYLEGELDYEMQTSYTLQIMASDRAWETKSTTASLVINVVDVDDNPPVFEQREYFVTVAENTPSAEYITQVTAVDADSDQFSQFTYAIIGGDGQNFFTIDENDGVIRTQGNLDYEQGQREYQVTITAANSDDSQRDTIHLHVEITGINEFSPRFLQREYEFTVSEGAPDGALVGTVLALDSDAGPDGKVLYVLIGASNDVGFAINAETGQLIVSKANGVLDREMTSEVILSVLAKNEGPLTGTTIDEATITVNIIDANDAPVFSSEQYTASVREDAEPQTYITTVTAREFDQNPAFRQFVYTFREDSHYDLFDIDETTGRITLRGTLDRETAAVHHITVAAVDSGSPPMTGTTEVVLLVEDVNDNGPVLLGSNAMGTITENQPKNTYVMTLNASDPDFGSNPASFRYRLTPLSDAFTLDDVTGVLRTSKRLNREEQVDYYLQVEITDGGSPLMAATSTLHIVVQDENDQLSSPRNARIEVKMYQSMFPGGTLGTVKPIDGDLGDTFDCEIVSGDQSKFSILSDCVLYSEVQSSVMQYTVNVSGSDGTHPSVVSTFSVSFQDYYDATLEASITIQISGVNAKGFLMLHYDKFMAALSSILSSIEEVIVLSLTDADDLRLNVLLAVKRGNGYMSKEEITRLLEDNKATVQSRAEITISVINFSACFSNPCLNQGTCQSHHHVDFTATAVESVPIILVGPVSRHTFTCECGQEFFGDRCQTEINQCESDPCFNSGQCLDLVGDFECECLPGFSGKQCQTNIDECSSSPCRNGGHCADLINGYRCECLVGYSGSNCQDGPCALSPCMNGATCEELGSDFTCRCSFQFWGPRCEHSSLGFDAGSFLTYSSLKGVENSVLLEFATTLPDGLLFYNHDGSTSQNGHFFLLEVLDGRVHFAFNLGAGTVSMVTEMRVDDGNWHRIQAVRKAQNGELFVIDEACSSLPDSACRATGASPNLAKIELSLGNNPVFVGGVDSILQVTSRHWQASSVDFVGCMREVSIDGEVQTIGSSHRWQGVTEGCARDESICSRLPCGEGSICIDEWWDTWCQCQTCRRDSVPSSFDGNSFVEYVPKEIYRRKELLNQAKEGSRKRRATAVQQLKFSFRTDKSSCALVFVKSGQKFTLIEVEDSMVRYSYGIGDYSQGTIYQDAVKVDDSRWHNITLECEDRSVTLQIDEDGKKRNFNNGLPHDFTGLEVDTLVLGGTPTALVIDEQELSGFSGCIQWFEFDGEAMPFSGANERFEVVPSESVGSGCAATVDLCASLPCGAGQSCIPAGTGFTCYDQPCLSSPCQNGGSCYERDQSFICSCSDDYMGEFCTRSVVQPSTGAPTPDLIIVVVIAIVVVVILVVVILTFLLVRRRYQRQPRQPKSNTYAGNGSMDNPTFITNDTFDDATMIGYNTSKLHEDDHLSSMQRQPDIIDQNVQSSAVPSNSSPEVEKLEDNNQNDNFPEHYDIENASSIAPSDIDVAYHYRHYHDREGRRKKHRRSPNPMLARIQASPSRESPLSMNRQSPNPFIGRVSPSIFGSSTPVPPHYRYSPNVMLMHTAGGGMDLRRAASPYSHSEGRNIPTPVGSEHSELRSVAHRSDVSSVRSGRTGRTKSPMSAVSVPSQNSRRSRPKTPVSGKSSKKGQPLGLTADEVAKLNSARPDLMSGTHSHTSTIDNLSSASDEANINNLSRPPTLLEPPESSSDESAASFTCSEMEPDLDNYIISKLGSIDNVTAATSNGRLDSDGGSQRTPFSSEDENGGSRGPDASATHFSLDQLLNWGPSFQNLSPVCRDIAMLNDLSGGKKSPKVHLDANINGEEFV